ncbi:DM DNA binding domain-containing protein [Ditylenchus destructor]|nr:DM DNA binding domain-containing protein [Ditylenchus destructor]
MSEVESSPQRFFGFSKRVPKDVKRFCGICKQHNEFWLTRGHVCKYKDCDCASCQAVRNRRAVMSQQIRLRRAQDKHFQRTTVLGEADIIPTQTASALVTKRSVSMSPGALGIDDAMMSAESSMSAPSSSQPTLMPDLQNGCYVCQKCKNHNQLVYKKKHKRECPYVECTCDKCSLIETRRKLDQSIKRRKSNTASCRDSAKNSEDRSSGSSSVLSALPGIFSTGANSPSSSYISENASINLAGLMDTNFAGFGATQIRRDSQLSTPSTSSTSFDAESAASSSPAQPVQSPTLNLSTANHGNMSMATLISPLLNSDINSVQAQLNGMPQFYRGLIEDNQKLKSQHSAMQIQNAGMLTNSLPENMNWYGINGPLFHALSQTKPEFSMPISAEKGDCDLQQRLERMIWQHTAPNSEHQAKMERFSTSPASNTPFYQNELNPATNFSKTTSAQLTPTLSQSPVHNIMNATPTSASPNNSMSFDPMLQQLLKKPLVVMPNNNQPDSISFKDLEKQLMMHKLAQQNNNFS